MAFIDQLRHLLRLLHKHKIYALTSMLGLALGISSFLFIGQYVSSSLAYDLFHSKAAHIYSISMGVNSGEGSEYYATTGKPVGAILQEAYPAVKSYARLNSYGDVTLQVEDKKIAESDFFHVNPEALDVFDFHFLRGDQSLCLTSPYSMILSESTATKVFGSLDCIEKQLKIGEDWFTVTGVFEDWPVNSHLEIHGAFVKEISASSFEAQDWFDLENYHYVLLDKEKSHKDLDLMLAEMQAKHLTPLLEGSGIAVDFVSRPLLGLYFEAPLIDDLQKGNLDYVYALSAAGILILLIACLNYINFNFILSHQRNREYQVRKILGMNGKSSIRLRTRESLFVTALVLSLSCLIVLIIYPYYLEVGGFKLNLSQENLWISLLMLILVFGCGFFGTGLSRLSLSFAGVTLPVKSGRKPVFQKMMLGFQFLSASTLLVVSVVIFLQIEFVNQKDLGFEKEEIMILSLPEEDQEKATLLRDQILSFTAVKQASVLGGGALPGEDNGKDIFEVEQNGQRRDHIYNIYRIDHNYFDLLDIKLSEGRNFNRASENDRQNSIIINEALAQSLNWKKPVGRTIWYYDQPRQVIGVVKNFHNKSLHNLIEPIAFIYSEQFPSNLLVRTSPEQLQEIEKAWSIVFADVPFSVTYFDQFIKRLYYGENKLLRLLSYFTFVALALCTIGLFTVFSMHTMDRTKEMSIRKVVGANAFHLLRSSTANHAVIILLSLLASIPLSNLILEEWLRSFEYRIEISSSVYIFTLTFVLLIAIGTISYHVLKVIRVNPVETLKYE